MSGVRASVRPREGTVDYKMKRGDDVVVDSIFSTHAKANSIFAPPEKVKMNGTATNKKSGKKAAAIEIDEDDKENTDQQSNQPMVDIVDYEHKYDDEVSVPKKVVARPLISAPTSSLSSFFGGSKFSSSTTPISQAPTTTVTAPVNNKKRPAPTTETAEVKRPKKAASKKAEPIPSFSLTSTAPAPTSSLPTWKTSTVTSQSTVVSTPIGAKKKAATKKKSKIEAEELFLSTSDDTVMEVEEETRMGSAIRRSASKPKKSKTTTPTKTSTPMEMSSSSPTVAATTPPTVKSARRTPPKSIVAPAPVTITATSNAVSTSITPSFLRTSRTSPTPKHHSSHYRSSSAIASASALLQDFQSSTALQKILQEKEAMFDSLLLKYNTLKSEKKLELKDLVDQQNKNEGLISATALLAQHKIEIQEKSETIEQLQKDVKSVSAQLDGQLQETTTQAELIQSLQNQLEESKQKLLESETKFASQQCALTQSKMDEYEKIIRTYSLFTSMQVLVKDDGWVNCAMWNPSDHRVVDFDLDVDGEEEIEYTPKRIELKGITYPSWMDEGLMVESDMAPRLLKVLLSNVFKKEGEQ